MHIPKDTVLAIQEAARVEEVLSDFLSLQKKGKKYLCPFHQDSHPSFSITSDGQFYKCFSCQAKGNSVSYLMEQQGMTYPEAMHYLAKKYGIAWEPTQATAEEVAREKEQQALYILLETVQTYYMELLRSNPSLPAYRYLEERELASPELLDRFGLGYSLDEWRALYDFGQGKGYEEETLLKAGLILKKDSDSKPYDRFRGRLMFPIHNTSGRVIGFGARHLQAGQVGAPKYINSPETPTYQKSLVLYGLFQAKQAIKREGNCYLVEGYTDVLGMHQAGISNVVASGGTALTIEQIKLLKRFSHHITLLFDGDSAGQQAAMRGIDLLLAQGCDIKVVCLPEKEDPDSYRRTYGSQALAQYLATHVQDFITFKSHVLFEAAGQDPTKRAEATHTLLTTIAAIPDGIKRSFYIQSCSEKIGLEQELLQEKLQALLEKKASTPSRTTFYHKKKPSYRKKGAVQQLEHTLFYILLHYAEKPFEQEQCIADYFFQELPQATFSTPAYQAVWEGFKAEWLAAETPITGTQFLAQQTGEMAEVIRHLMGKPVQTGPQEHPSSNWLAKHQVFILHEEEDLAKRAYKNIQRLKLAHVTEAMSQAAKQLAAASTEEEQLTYGSKHNELKRTQIQIARSLGTTLLPITPPSHSL